MSKLHAKDLMVGDYVQFPATNHIFKVQTISGGEQETLHYVTAKNGNGDFLSRSEWDGIPLTNEILEKNGFEGDGYAFLVISNSISLQYYYHEHRLRKYYYGIDEWDNHKEVKNITFQCHCYYVHELQRALKLCGIEKEIEL